MHKELPKVYDPREVESSIYKKWMDNDCIRAAPNPDKKPFSIVMPPPNVTGQLHMGHAMDCTLQDILIRYKRMQGYEALWLPGSDHAGIATQIKVEEELRKSEGLTRHDLGREKFLERVWAWKEKYGSRIVEQQKKMGASCDWSRDRFTMDEGCSRAVRETFCELYEKGLIYKGSRIINWCPHCLTALSDAEVEYTEKPGNLWYVRYPLTDGTGGLTFFKTLLAEYLSQKYGLTIPAGDGVLGRLEEPDAEELEDSFLRYAGNIKASRKEATAWHLTGTPEKDGFKDLVTLMIPAPVLKECAKAHGVTVTELLCAAMMQAICQLQAEKVPQRRLRKPVKVLLPVNLRNLFPSKTLRNFASYITPEVDPRMGDYTFDEICAAVHHRMGLENNPQTMRAKFAANVASEQSPLLRVMPLFIKNLAMKAVFDTVGECKSCLCLSNLGVVRLPEVMAPYVVRMDFIIGVQAKAPHNCGVLTWNDTVYINCIRSIREPELELHFYRVLHQLGLPVKVESNQR